jgi:hypothetical protein
MKWLTVDPGDTTGWALWEDKRDEPIEVGQTPNWDFVDALAEGLGVGTYADFTVGECGGDACVEGDPSGPFAGVRLIVCEDFLLYPWELRDGSMDWDAVETARVIGGILTLARIADIRVVLQGADIKERAEAGGAEDLFVRPLYPNRHANDAIRHGVHYRQTVLLSTNNARVEGGRLVVREETTLQREAREALEARGAVPSA